jgi:hypothetical protein
MKSKLERAIATGFGNLGVSAVKIGNKIIKTKLPRSKTLTINGCTVGDHVNVWVLDRNLPDYHPALDSKGRYLRASNAIVTTLCEGKSMTGESEILLGYFRAETCWQGGGGRGLLRYPNNENYEWTNILEKVTKPVAPYISPSVAHYVYEVLVANGAASINKWPGFLRAMSCHKFGCAELQLDPNCCRPFPAPFSILPTFYNPDWRIDFPWGGVEHNDKKKSAARAMEKINAELKVLKERWQASPWEERGLAPPCFMKDPASYRF